MKLFSKTFWAALSVAAVSINSGVCQDAETEGVDVDAEIQELAKALEESGANAAGDQGGGEVRAEAEVKDPIMVIDPEGPSLEEIESARNAIMSAESPEEREAAIQMLQMVIGGTNAPTPMTVTPEAGGETQE